MAQKRSKNTNSRATSKSKSQYVSNPFKLVFQGMDAWLKYNQTFAVFVIVVSFSGALMNLFFSFDPTNMRGPFSNSPVAAIFSTIILLLIIMASIAFTTIYSGMVAYVGLKTLKKKNVTFAEAIQASLEKFWIVLLVQIIVFLKVLGGLLLFIIPGVRAALRYSIVNFYIFDKNSTAKEAISQTKDLTRDHLIEVFGLQTAASIVPVVGGLLMAGGQTKMYSQLTRLKKSKSPKPPIHWLNYLGIFLLFGIMLLIMIILVFAIIALTQLSKISG